MVFYYLPVGADLDIPEDVTHVSMPDVPPRGRWLMIGGLALVVAAVAGTPTVPSVVALGGLVMMSGGFVLLRSDGPGDGRVAIDGLRSHGVVTAATVVSRTADSVGWVMWYDYLVGGRKYRGKHGRPRGERGPRAGEEIRIAYDPERPGMSVWLPAPPPSQPSVPELPTTTV